MSGKDETTINPITKRVIKIGGNVYKKLIKKGYKFEGGKWSTTDAFVPEDKKKKIEVFDKISEEAGKVISSELFDEFQAFLKQKKSKKKAPRKKKIFEKVIEEDKSEIDTDHGSAIEEDQTEIEDIPSELDKEE